MNYSRTHIIILLAVVYVLLPLGLLSMVWFVANSSPALKILFGAGILNVSFILYRIGYWEFQGLVVRNALPVLACAAAVFPFFRASGAETSGFALAAAGVMNILLAIESAAILRAGKRPEVYLDVQLPFPSGSYYVTDGGDGRASRLVNYHFYASVHKGAATNRAMAYAVDLVRTNRWGFTTKGFVPRTNDGYLIFGEPVVSPVAGRVAAVTDGIMDNTPFCRKYPYNVGNNVVIRVEQTYIVLGHIKNGSITVKVGDRVQPGDVVGRVGNSGLSERPHLHMQASRCEDGDYWKGEGVPLLFNGSVPLKGKVFHVHH
jgi:hypothetical protein